MVPTGFDTNNGLCHTFMSLVEDVRIGIILSSSAANASSVIRSLLPGIIQSVITTPGELEPVVAVVHYLSYYFVILVRYGFSCSRIFWSREAAEIAPEHFRFGGLHL